MRNNHEIDYKIYGEELQFVEVELDPGETVIGEPGGFMMMDDGVEMATLFGDGSAASQQGGLLSKLMNAGKRVLVGENLFMTAFTNIGQGTKRVSFASPYTGKIIPLDLQQLGGTIIAKGRLPLCSKRRQHRHRLSAPPGHGNFWRRRFYHGKTRRRWHGFCSCRRLYHRKGIKGRRDP